MNRRAFLLGSAAAAGVQALGPGTWVRRAYSFLWTRPEPWSVLYIDTDMAVRHEVAVVGSTGQWSHVTCAELDRKLREILASKKRLVGEACLYDRTWTP